MNKDSEMEKLKIKIDSLAEELLMTYEQLNLFYDISSSMGSPLDYEKTMDFILSKAVEIIEADKAAIMVLDESENKLKIRKGLVSGNWIAVDPSHEISTEGTILSKAIHAKGGLIVNDITECRNGISPLIATKSLLMVSLYTKNKVIGVFTVGDRRGRDFTSNDLKLSTVLSSQAALIIENDRLLQENMALAEIGRIIGSTLNIEDVYERFAEEVMNLIPFGRLTINLIDYGENNCISAYSAGNVLSGRQPGDVFPLAGSATEEVVKTHRGIIFHPESRGEVADRFPGLLAAFEAGHHSMMIIPLISNDEVIGSMYFGSTRLRTYTARDLRLAEGIGSQIAGAIANAQLFLRHKQAEEEKRALEEQLRQSQKMEAIGRLAGGIAHDFNNLLTVIKGYSELSLITLKGDNLLRGNIEEIKKASDRASDLTRQLLAFSRRQMMELKVLDLRNTLQNLERMLRRIIGEDIELIMELHDDLGKVKVDPGQIEQVILNLAVNAKDAMPNGGNLIIEIATTELDEEYARKHVAVKPGFYVTLSVTDTGCGMTPEVRERVFEPFFTTKEKGKGTGLGLSTVYGIVKQSGGNIWVYSEPGHGTTFKIYLPRVDEPLDEMLEKEVREELPHGNETILVVEDEDEVRQLAVQILEKQGYQVLEASHPAEASLLCEQHAGTIHLMLTDVVLPVMNGRKLAEALLSLRHEMKVLYMSGYTDNAISHYGVLDEGLSYIQKPFTIDRLARKLREVLDRPGR